MFLLDVSESSELNESWSFPASFFRFLDCGLLMFPASVGHSPRVFIVFWSLNLLSVIFTSYWRAGLNLMGEMSELVDVPIIGRLELFLLESAWISFFIK